MVISRSPLFFFFWSIYAALFLTTMNGVFGAKDTIQLTSNEGDKLSISLQATKHSSFLRNMVEFFDLTSKSDEKYLIPIENLNTETLERFIEYSEHVKNEEVHNADYYLEHPYSLTDFDREFLDSLNDDSLFLLTMAADFMGAEKLLQASKQT